MPPALKTAKFVFLRDDRIKPALSPPYTGPFRVIRRARNTYLLQMGTQQKWQSINRLKPAYLTETETNTTRGGRAVIPPDRLQVA